jgi:hypothetical protein
MWYRSIYVKKRTTLKIEGNFGGGRISVVAEEGENAGDTQKTLAT